MIYMNSVVMTYHYKACRVVASIEKCEMTWSNESVSGLMMVFILIFAQITVESYFAIRKTIDDPCLPTRARVVSKVVQGSFPKARGTCY